MDLKPREHIKKRRLGIIKGNFDYINRDIISVLVLVRPVLEYAIQCWSPFLVGDIDALERVQRRGSKLVPELAGLDHEESCRQLVIQTLKDKASGRYDTGAQTIARF